jgi:hypothetical protein
MSWEDTDCPCGGKKERETMLCRECETYLADHPAMKHFRDEQCPPAGRRHAAIVLLTCSRSRKRHQAKQRSSSQPSSAAPEARP